MRRLRRPGRRPRLNEDPTFWRDALPPWWLLLLFAAVWSVALYLSIVAKP